MHISRKTLVMIGVVTALLGQFIVDQSPAAGIIVLGISLACALVEGWYFPTRSRVWPAGVIMLLGLALWNKPQGWFFMALGAIEIGTALRRRPAGVEPAGVGPAGVEPAGVGPAEVGPAEVGPAEVGPAEIGPAGEGGENEADGAAAGTGAAAGALGEAGGLARDQAGAATLDETPPPWPAIPSQEQPLYMKGALYGLGAAVAGAFAWFIVVKVTGYNLGLVAWLVGRFVGRSVRFGAGGRGDRQLQVISAVLGGFGILGGYYLNFRDQLVQALMKNHVVWTEGAKFSAVVSTVIKHPEIIGVFGAFFTAIGVYDAYLGAAGQLAKSPPAARDFDLNQSGR